MKGSDYIAQFVKGLGSRYVLFLIIVAFLSVKTEAIGSEITCADWVEAIKTDINEARAELHNTINRLQDKRKKLHNLDHALFRSKKYLEIQKKSLPEEISMLEMQNRFYTKQVNDLVIKIADFPNCLDEEEKKIADEYDKEWDKEHFGGQNAPLRPQTKEAK